MSDLAKKKSLSDFEAEKKKLFEDLNLSQTSLNGRTPKSRPDPPLTFTIDKKALFYRIMCEWYQELKPEVRNQLTDFVVCKKAGMVQGLLFIPRLPDNWAPVLRCKHLIRWTSTSDVVEKENNFKKFNTEEIDEIGQERCYCLELTQCIHYCHHYWAAINRRRFEETQGLKTNVVIAKSMERSSSSPSLVLRQQNSINPVKLNLSLGPSSTAPAQARSYTNNNGTRRGILGELNYSKSVPNVSVNLSDDSD